MKPHHHHHHENEVQRYNFSLTMATPQTNKQTKQQNKTKSNFIEPVYIDVHYTAISTLQNLAETVVYTLTN